MEGLSAEQVQDEYCSWIEVHDECFGDWLQAERERQRS